MRSQIDYTEHEADELSVGARTSKAVSLAHPELASVPAARGRESRSSRQIALTVCQPKVFYAHSCVPRGLAPGSDGPRWNSGLGRAATAALGPFENLVVDDALDRHRDPFAFSRIHLLRESSRPEL